MPPEWTTFLLRYGELGIKGDAVRRRFEARLVRNVQAHFTRASAPCVVRRDFGRLYLDTPRPEVASHAISHTFGLVSGSPALVTKPTLDSIEDTVAGLATDLVPAGSSFAIRARRTGGHPFSSMDAGARGGAGVLRVVPSARVDLDAPDVELYVEVRDDAAYVFSEIVEGPGGLPMGSQGLVVVPLSGPRSVAAAWFAMRRGASVHGLVGARSAEAVTALATWAPGMDVSVLALEPSCAGLGAAAHELARRIGAGAVVLEDTESEATAPVPGERLALRPLAGLPLARWPRGARAVLLQAEKLSPGPYVVGSGAGPDVCCAALSGAERRKL